MSPNHFKYFEHLAFLYLDPKKELHTPNFLASNSSTVLPYCNRVYIPNTISPAEWKEIQNFYHGFPYTIWIDAQNKSANESALQAGLQFCASYPLMIADLQKLPAYMQDKSITVKQIHHQFDILTDWTSLVSTAYNISFIDFQKFVAFLLATPHVDNLRFYIGYYDDEPVATSLFILQNNIAGMHWVGTLPAFRNKGIGYAVSCFPLHEIKTRVDHAILYSSSMGKSVYEKIGFIENAMCCVYETRKN